MINSRRELEDYLVADEAAHGVQGWRRSYRITRRILYYQRLLRVVEYYENCRPDAFGVTYLQILKLRSLRLGETLGFEIPRRVFGPGLRIGHVGSISVNADVRVGANCILLPSTTLGDVRGDNPVIGNNVYIGPGARVLGGIKIGNWVAIAANAVVLGDVPDNVTVGGVPARIISNYGSRRIKAYDG